MGMQLSDWVELFQAGFRQGTLYTLSDIDDAVRNFYEWRGKLDPPAVIGHSADQSWLTDSGLPAAGWPQEMRRTGDKLEARFGQMPPLIETLITNGAYKKVSVELYPRGKPPAGLPINGIAVRRIAFMGGALPDVKTLKQMADLWKEPPVAKDPKAPARVLQFSESCQLPDGISVVFSEVMTVDRTALNKQLLDAGYSQAMIDTLATVPDAQFPALVAEAVKRAAPVVPPVVSPVVPIAPPVVVPVATPAPTSATITPAQFAEWEARTQAVERRLSAAEQARQAEEAESRRRQQAERARTVETFCERWVRDGHILPAEADRGAKVPNLFHRLMVADGTTVRKFGEVTATDFDAQVSEIEARGPGYARRHFSEQIAQPATAAVAVEAEAIDYAKRRNKRAG